VGAYSSRKNPSPRKATNAGTKMNEEKKRVEGCNRFATLENILEEGDRE